MSTPVLGLGSTGEIRRRLVGVTITGALVAGGLVSGCAGNAKAPQNASILHVTERDFKITAPKEIRAGNVELVSRNRGPDDHELIVVRENGAPLPFRTDGITIDEDAIETERAGALEPFGGTTIGTLHLRLRPGRYVLFCNMAGHYLGGMHTTLVVD